MGGQSLKTDFGIAWTINLDICSFFSGGVSLTKFWEKNYFRKKVSILGRLTVAYKIEVRTSFFVRQKFFRIFVKIRNIEISNRLLWVRWYI